MTLGPAEEVTDRPHKFADKVTIAQPPSSILVLPCENAVAVRRPDISDHTRLVTRVAGFDA